MVTYISLPLSHKNFAMQQIIENILEGRWRSYKTFHRNGDVNLHSKHTFYEYHFEDGKNLTITYNNNSISKRIAKSIDWKINLDNKRHYLTIKDNHLKYEIVTINHEVLVLIDPTSNEKIFYARSDSWEHYITGAKQAIL
jgi:biotin-(acetyl-CoA carboxylase) ligase